MKHLKYVITNKREVITFPESIEHSVFRGLNIASAGFVSIWTIGNTDGTSKLCFECKGESLSLGGVKSRGDYDERMFELSGEV